MTYLAQAMLPSFLVPGLAAAGAAAVSIPILIHILSRRPRRPEPWAAMRFLLAAYRKHRMRTRLEQWLLLMMRCLLILLIGLALAGPVWAAVGALAGFGAEGRTVILVLDHSLTSGAADADEPGRRRFDRLRATADRLLESLTPADRVALVSASRPAEAVVAPPTADPAAVRRQIELAEPTHAAADLPGALRTALDVIEQAEQAQPTYLVLLSDFSAGAAHIDSPLPGELAQLGERARLLMASPAPGSDNVQVAELRPERRVVTPDAGGGAPTATWTLTLRRFSEAAPAGGLTTVRLQVPGALAVRRAVQWSDGQHEAEVRIDTPLDDDGLMVAEASLEPEAAAADALEADNRRWATIEARRRLNVMVLTRRDPDAAGFPPHRWVSTALAPVSDRLGWPIELNERDASTLGNARRDLRDADAVLVLRPDLLDDAGWEALGEWAEAGGLAWFMPPADPTPSLWPQRLADTFGLGWSVELEPAEASDDQPLRPATDQDAVAELSRLRADLPDLLRPVEVYRRLPIDPATLDAGTDVLIEGAGGEPLMIGSLTRRGRGRILLLASAIDPEWTNLPIKPLFVALMHETLRAAMDLLQPPDRFQPGDRPHLGPRWQGVSRLVDREGAELLLVSEPDDEPSSESDASGEGESVDENGDAERRAAIGGPRPIRPFTGPGIYRSDDEVEALVVNVDADAADTRGLTEAAVRAWLEPAGEWHTIDPADPEAPMRTAAEQANLSWPLLWAVLALAVAEMLFARFVSHASTAHRVEAAV